MILKRVKIKNIRSYEDAEILLPEGSVLLSGDIGAGKTSILLSIEFALFGLQPGQKGASLLKNGKDSGSVELEFEVEGDNIIISRALKRKKTVSQETTIVTINGKSEEKAVTEMKNFVLNLLNYPTEFAKKTNLLYRYTVYTPQEHMKEIILEDPEARLNTLRHVFGIDKYKRIKENTTILSSKLREMMRLKQGQIGDLETIKSRLMEKKNSLSELELKIPEIEKEILNIKILREKKDREISEIREKIEEKKKLENEVEKSNILLITKREQISKLGIESKILKERFEQATKEFNEEEFNELKKKIEEKKTILDSIRKEITEFQIKYSSFTSKKNELEFLKNKISSLTKCPTCLQDVGDEHKNSLLSQTDTELSQINEKVIAIESQKNKKEEEKENINKILMESEASLRRLEAIKIRLKTIEEDHKKLEEMEKNKKMLESDVNILTEQISRLKETILVYKKYDNFVEIKNKEIEEIKSKERQVEIRKAESVKEIEFSKSYISEIESQIAEKEKTKQELMYLTELENWLSKDFLEMIGTIERNVMVKLRDEFSKLFNDWFSILVPDVFVVRLDDNFTPIIEQQGYEIDYSFMSGGERTSIALAYRLALNQTINSVMSEIKTKGLVILDEPTEGFSQQQLDKMRDVLAELNVDQLIMVSHDQKIESFVDNIVKLKKDEGVSSVAGSD